MNGIAEFLFKNVNERNSEGKKPRILQNITCVIPHCGLDDKGFFKSITRDQKYNIGIANRHLSIIDLDSGHQPMSNEDGSMAIVFNGEIELMPHTGQSWTQVYHQFRYGKPAISIKIMVKNAWNTYVACSPFYSEL